MGNREQIKQDTVQRDHLHELFTNVYHADIFGAQAVATRAMGQVDEMREERSRLLARLGAE